MKPIESQVQNLTKRKSNALIIVLTAGPEPCQKLHMKIYSYFTGYKSFIPRLVFNFVYVLNKFSIIFRQSAVYYGPSLRICLINILSMVAAPVCYVLFVYP